jgi:hypothetical protein
MTKRLRATGHQHLAQRRHHLLGEDRRAHGLGQHRVEGGVALLGHQRQLHPGAEAADERACRHRAGKAAADDDDGPGLGHLVDSAAPSTDGVAKVVGALVASLR